MTIGDPLGNRWYYAKITDAGCHGFDSTTFLWEVSRCLSVLLTVLLSVQLSVLPSEGPPA